MNDHLAGAAAGVELARRALKENRENDFGRSLAALAAEIGQDRQTLIALMEGLAIPRWKEEGPAAWALEKVGRLKLNGIEAKRARWLALLQVRANDERLRDFGLESLAARADEQRRRLEAHRLAAVDEAMCSA